MVFAKVHQVTLAVCLPTMATLLYLLWKYRDEEEEPIPPKTSVVTSRQTVIEVKVPQRAVGAVIGSQGSTIKDIQERTGAKVKFRDDDKEQEERVLLVRGTHESSQKAELIIKKIIADQPPIIEDTITVPNRCLGRIIGRQGTMIRQLMKTSKCRINIDKNSEEESRDGSTAVQLKGTPVAIEHAKGLIQEIIAEEELSRVQLSALAAKRRDRYSMKPGGIEHDNKPHDQMFTSRDIRPGARNEYGLPPGEFPPGVRGQDGAAELNVNTTNGVQEINKERLGLQEDTVLQNNEASDSASDEEEETKGGVLSEGGDSWPKHSTFFEVYVSAVDTPGHFWVQRVTSHSARLDKIIDEMSVAYNNPQFSYDVPAGAVPVGSIIAAPFSFDDRWYRAKVINVNPDEYDVYYVDFGDNGFVPKEKAMKLRPEFLTLPFQAFECNLAHVRPVASTVWSSEATDLFEEISHCAKWKVMMCRTVSTSKIGSTVIPCVELVDTTGKQVYIRGSRK